MKIVKKALSEISPYYNNPRDNASAVAPTMESIRRFGFVKPIIVDKDGVIIAGHTRYIAAYQLGIQKVPVIYTDMDEERARQFRIADNKLAEKSAYDEDALIEELKQMAIPEDMQAFFMEDVHEMVNFSMEDFAPSVPVDTGFEAPMPQYDEHEEEASSYVETEEEPEITDPAEGLFKVREEDGHKYMKVICPYCGNIEEIEMEE